MEKKVDGIVRELFRRCNSTQRLPAFLKLIEGAPPEVFWAVFQEVWSSCDDTWEHQALLQRAMYRNRPGHPHLKGSNLAFWKSLPKRVTIFRGCDATRWRSLSWTTDRAVAESFAQGHRGIRCADPVVLQTTVSRAFVWGVCTDREESEVLVKRGTLKDEMVALEWYEPIPEEEYQRSENHKMIIQGLREYTAERALFLRAFEDAYED